MAAKPCSKELPTTLTIRGAAAAHAGPSVVLTSSGSWSSDAAILATRKLLLSADERKPAFAGFLMVLSGHLSNPSDPLKELLAMR